jgi:hypothetical protein
MPRRRISTFPLLLLFDAEFAKATDKNILATLQSFFDQLQQRLQHIRGLLLGQVELSANGIDDVIFGDGHDSTLLLKKRLINR